MRLQLMSAAVLALAACSPPPADKAQAPVPLTAEQHVAAAEALKARNPDVNLSACQARAPGARAATPGPEAGKSAVFRMGAESPRVTPTKVFDNLYYVGSAFIGVWVLQTSAGLILFDSGITIADARDHVAPELRKLGLDPASVKYVVVTHGHWDHHGGAPYFQDAYKARILSADWDVMEKAPAWEMEKEGEPVPRRDIEVTDGQKLTLGDATVSLYVTPGHSPGTVSAILPVKDGGKTHMLVMLGGTALPPTRGPNNRSGGLVSFGEQVLRLNALAKAAGAEGTLSTHADRDGGLRKIGLLAARKPGDPHPFLIGPDAVDAYYQAFNHCIQAAIARPEGGGQWATPFPE